MKIFYTFSVKNDDQIKSTHEKIVKFLRSTANEVDVYKYFPSDIVDPGSEEDTNPLEIIRRIKTSDVFIGEMSRASQTLGFLLSFAVQNGKPSLYLYPTNTYGKPGKFISQNPSRLISVEKYDGDEFQEQILKFLEKAKRKLQVSRTTFVSTKEIDSFIDSELKESGLTKGEIIRKLLEDSIGKFQKK